jgi:hypothetical protein
MLQLEMDRQTIQSHIEEIRPIYVEIRHCTFRWEEKANNKIIWYDVFERRPGMCFYETKEFVEYVLQEFISGTAISFLYQTKKASLTIDHLEYFKNLKMFIDEPVLPFDWIKRKNSLVQKVQDLKSDMIGKSSEWRIRAKNYIDTIESVVSNLDFMERNVPEIYKHVILPQEKRNLFYETDGLVNFLRRTSI